MRYYVEESLTEFKFWGGAVPNAEQLTFKELEKLDEILSNDFFTEEYTDTQINDLLWFDFEQVCEWLGLELDDNGDIVRD